MDEKTLLKDFLSCHVCLETFKDPVSLSCSHNFCSSCLKKFWEEAKNRNCPTCKRKSSKDAVVNFSLKGLADSFAGTQTGGSSETEKEEKREEEEKEAKPGDLMDFFCCLLKLFQCCGCGDDGNDNQLVPARRGSGSNDGGGGGGGGGGAAVVVVGDRNRYFVPAGEFPRSSNMSD
ncbi:E3 ubiquitin-protein ligase TRIM35-like [Cololabis saira]|uniref:E3 ubiquitin-protein ligase TRIM35-like n=1 Tax=Cololabis saira TaxID=129043 RepID=UPI002AD57145|nr:E3 ubiquitin-protein ligase TRIM35-like [Cololabis saira]